MKMEDFSWKKRGNMFSIRKDHARVRDQENKKPSLICQFDRGSDSDLLMIVKNPGNHLI